MHGQFVEAFVGSDGFGPARMPPMLRQVRHYETRGLDDAGWCLREVALVGVDRHDPPVLHLGSPVAPAHAGTGPKWQPPERTRPLEAEEGALLQQLRGSAASIAWSADQPRLAMGAVRARQDCLRCHRHAREGALLGAFAYRLGHLQPAAPDSGLPPRCL